MEVNAQNVKILEEQLAQAIKSHDLIKIDKLIHKDFMFIAPNGITVTKEMDLASHRSGNMIVEALNVTIEDIRVIEDCAISMSVYHTKGRFMDMPIEGVFKYIRTWKQTSDGIQVIGGSCIRIES